MPWLCGCGVVVTADEAALDRDYDADGAVAAAHGGPDCDDRNPLVLPGAVEVCNGWDDDCDGVTDGPNAEGATAWFPDADHDGHGLPSTPITDCAPVGHVPIGDDCDDANAAVGGACG